MLKKSLIALFVFISSLSFEAWSKFGDVNGDNVVNASDVTSLYNMLLKGEDYPSGDLNSDNVVNSADLTILYNELLNGVSDAITLCPDDNHPHMIDLGLPSGTLWACCNIGAKSPTEYGDYFAWGETQPKSVYDWSTYKWGTVKNELTKYCTDSQWGQFGLVDNKTELDLDDDAAYVNWGSDWRMPSREQLQELLDNCTSEWTTFNGVGGRLFKSHNNSASLFLPVAGYRYGSWLYDSGSYSGYWSRILVTSYPYGAYYLKFQSGNVSLNPWPNNRINGQCVRAVRVSQN